MTSKKLPVAIVVAFIFSASQSLLAANYAKLMSNAVKGALGDQFKSYKWSTYPTDNFGLGTSYVSTSNKPKVDPANFICATNECLGIKPADLPQDPKERLKLLGFAATGTGAPIAIDSKDANSFALSAVVPGILKIFGLTAKIDSKKIRTTEVTFGSATIRFLDPDKMKARLSAAGSGTKLRKTFDAGDLVLVVSDVVIDGLTVSVDVNDQATAELKAALDKNVTKVVGEGTNLELKVESGTQGKYVLKAVNPLVVATLLKKQPGAGELAEDKTWSRWTTVDKGKASNEKQ